MLSERNLSSLVKRNGKHRLNERSHEVETSDAVYRRNKVHFKKTFEASDTTDINLPLPAQEVSRQPQVINAEPSTTQPPPQPMPAKSPPKTRIPVHPFSIKCREPSHGSRTDAMA